MAALNSSTCLAIAYTAVTGLLYTPYHTWYAGLPDRRQGFSGRLGQDRRNYHGETQVKNSCESGKDGRPSNNGGDGGGEGNCEVEIKGEGESNGESKGKGEVEGEGEGERQGAGES